MTGELQPTAGKPRTLIIGLDGATFDLIDPWVAAGHLPNLARLMTEGTRGRLPSWPNINSAAAWSSIVTGYNAGQHGVFDFGENAPQRGQRWRAITAADRGQPAIWRRLSDAGQCVGAINVPISYPAESINGFVLGGMDSPGMGSPGFCHPPGLLAELRRAGIQYELDVPGLARYRNRDPYHMPDLVRRMVEGRARAVSHLLRNYDWDAVMAVFIATDRMQHQYWVNEPVTDDNPGWHALRSLYQLLDEHLGQWIDLAGSSATIMVISDHGFGPRRGAKHSLIALFEQLGLLRRRKGRKGLRGAAASQLMRLGRKIIPPPIQLRLAQALPNLRLRVNDERHATGIDWSETQVFTDQQQDFVYINLQGRQPEGIVPPADYEAVRQRARHVLLNLTDPASGRRLVKAVHDRESVYRGPNLSRAADLVIEWNEDALGDALRYEADGRSVVASEHKKLAAGVLWLGSHRSEGIFIARGPHIQPGTTVTSAHQYDIAPTVLHLQGQPVPADMDGRVLTEIFTESWLAAHPIRHSRPQAAEAAEPWPGLDEDETRQVETRLRDLGYIE